MAEMPRHTWLTRRKGGTYYLRAPVPTSLRASLKKNEITYSLKTKVQSEAQRLIVLESAKVRLIFDEALARLTPKEEERLDPAGSIGPLQMESWSDAHYLQVIDQDFVWRNGIWQRAQSDPTAFQAGHVVPHPKTEHYLAFAEEMELTERLLYCVRHQQEQRLYKLQQSLAVGDTSAQHCAADALIGKNAISRPDRLKLERRLMEREIAALKDIMRGDSDLYDRLLKEHAGPDDTSPLDPEPGSDKPKRKARGKQPTWDEVIGVWETAHANLGKPEPTRSEWRARVEKFAAWSKKSPAGVTAADVQAWRDHRLKLGVAPVTVADGDLSMIRGIFKVAVQEGVLAGNPAANVRVQGFKRKKPKAERMRGFSDAEAETILSAAASETQSYRRWVPWLCAATGSRLSTMMNLRPQDVKMIDGVPCLEVLAEAGPIKTDEASRVVPVHPSLIDQGFLDFVASRSGEPRLFYEQSSKRAGASQHNPGKTKGGHLRNWIKGLAEANNLEIGRAHRKDPTHAWRHRLKTVGRDAGVDGRILDAITGHAPKSDGESYGEVSVKAMLAALKKIKLP